MITVTLFEKLKQGKIRVAFDNGTEGILYRSECAPYQLEEGKELSPLQYEQLMKEVVGKRATKRIMYLLQQQDRSERQLREKLAAGGFPECCIDQAISYVKRYHYLDDRRLAENYIRLNQDRQSRLQISRKLMTKGVSGQTIRDALEDTYTADEMEQIMSLLRKRRFDRSTADEGELRRTYAFLARRGFGVASIRRAMGADLAS